MRSTKAFDENPAEDDRVRSANPRTSQNRNRQRGAHPHVDGDAVTLLDAERLQYVRALRHFDQQLLKGERLHFARLAFPDDGGLIAAMRMDVAVEAVVRDVDLAAREPFHVRTIPVEHLVPLLEPVEFASNLSPEFLRILLRLFVEVLVLLHALDVSARAENSGARRRHDPRAGPTEYFDLDLPMT